MDKSIGPFKTREAAERYCFARFHAWSDLRDRRVIAETPCDQKCLGHAFFFKLRTGWVFEVGAALGSVSV
jgi:hypothetical protein